MSGAGDPSGPFNDVVAHEHGHLIDYDYAGDPVIRGLNLEGRSVEEALADMFAFDYDRSDPTIGEESPAGAGHDWANPGSITRGGQPYPAHMDDYDRTPPAADDGEPSEHFNSTILSHAYYLFVQAVGSDKAGRVLHSVPQRSSPRPTFDEPAARVPRQRQRALRRPRGGFCRRGVQTGRARTTTP
jgi:Zn-dependent metalloprotease